jgi:hypothetical protein
MTGALAPFSSLVFHNVIFQILKLHCHESCPDVYFFIQQFTSQETDVSFIYSYKVLNLLMTVRKCECVCDRSHHPQYP